MFFSDKQLQAMSDDRVSYNKLADCAHTNTKVRPTEDSVDEEGVFLSPNKAKTLLRRKRDLGFIIGLLLLYAHQQEVNRENDERSAETRRRAEHNR